MKKNNNNYDEHSASFATRRFSTLIILSRGPPALLQAPSPPRARQIMCFHIVIQLSWKNTNPLG